MDARRAPEEIPTMEGTESQPRKRQMPEEDEELIKSVVDGVIDSYELQLKLHDSKRAVMIRREAYQRMTGKSLAGLLFDGFDSKFTSWLCCERQVGYIQIPVGIAGPLLLDGKEYTVPLATAESFVVASVDTGFKAIYASGGASSALFGEGMTSRASPLVRFASAIRAAELKLYLENPANFNQLAVVFNGSARLLRRLQSIKCMVAGKNLYMRFSCTTGDDIGTYSETIGVRKVLQYLLNDFPDMDVVGISGMYCSDNKPAAVNWIEGRGKSVVCEAIIKGEVVRKALKTSVSNLVELNMLKNLAGSAVVGALGGSNAHASNVVTAIFLATGQDPARIVESSNCITMMEPVNDGKDLHVSVTMPSIEVGTMRDKPDLKSQSACLKLLGIEGMNIEFPGSNARLLATIVAGSVLAAELSLMSAILDDQLANNHLICNRSTKAVSEATP